MQSLSSTARSNNLSSLGHGQFDVLVIGGGVTGAGVAVDAAARGYKVALVEKADFASGTSSKATKLVHGGVRYLSNFDFGLVHEALVERGLLLQNAPFLVKPLAFVLPMYEGDRHPVGMPITTPGGIGLGFLLNCGLLLYDILAGRRNVHRHRHLSYDQVMQSAPSLVTKGLHDGYVYYDAQTNDVRLTMTLLHTAARFGVTIANYAEVTSFVTEQGKVQGAVVHDRLADKAYTVRARHIISAAGVFTEKLEALTGDDPQVGVEPSKGVHLVFSREDIKLGDDAIVLPETDDKRILFIVPWESRVLFGTTDTGTGDLDHPTATQEDISYLLRHLNRYLSTPVTEAQIVSAFAGYRPLVKPKRADQSTAKLSRSHVVLQSPSGLVSIFGGKLTTYRRMAQDAVDVISQRDGTKPVHPTLNLPLAGSAGWPTAKRAVQARGQALKLDEQVIDHLGSSYGTEAIAVLDLVAEDASLGQRLIADLPYIRAEVIHACRQEMAMTPYDVLARRTSILLLDRQQGMGIVDEVAAMMAQELNWTPDQQELLAQDYRAASRVEVAIQ
jgi:glycerol-3-phosphate dehydrogenase